MPFVGAAIVLSHIVFMSLQDQPSQGGGSERPVEHEAHGSQTPAVDGVGRPLPPNKANTTQVRPLHILTSYLLRLFSIFVIGLVHRPHAALTKC